MRKWILISSVALAGLLTLAIIVVPNAQIDESTSITSAEQPSRGVSPPEEAEQSSNQSESAPTKPLTAEERTARLAKLTEESADRDDFLRTKSLQDLPRDQIVVEMLVDDDFPTRRTALTELQRQINGSSRNSQLLERPDSVKRLLIENLIGDEKEFSYSASSLIYKVALLSSGTRHGPEAAQVLAESNAGPLMSSFAEDSATRQALVTALQQSETTPVKARAAESLSYFFGYSAENESLLATTLESSDDPELNASIAQSLWTMYEPDYYGPGHTPSIPSLRALTSTLGNCNFRNCWAALDIIGSARPQFALTRLVSELAKTDNAMYFVMVASALSKYETVPSQTVQALRKLQSAETNATRKSTIDNLLAKLGDR